MSGGTTQIAAPPPGFPPTDRNRSVTLQRSCVVASGARLRRAREARSRGALPRGATDLGDDHCVGSSRPALLPPPSLSHTFTLPPGSSPGRLPPLPLPALGTFTGSTCGGLIAVANSRGAASAACTLSRKVPPRSTSPWYSSPASLANAVASLTSRPSTPSTT